MLLFFFFSLFRRSPLIFLWTIHGKRFFLLINSCSWKKTFPWIVGMPSALLHASYWFEEVYGAIGTLESFFIISLILQINETKVFHLFSRLILKYSNTALRKSLTGKPTFSLLLIITRSLKYLFWSIYLV